MKNGHSTFLFAGKAKAMKGVLLKHIFLCFGPNETTTRTGYATKFCCLAGLGLASCGRCRLRRGFAWGRKKQENEGEPIPIGSMYAIFTIFTYIWLFFLWFSCR